MFDLEISMPVSGIGKYGVRLNDFKRYGLLNVKNRTVRLVLLTGSERINNINIGWPANVEVLVSPNQRHDYLTSKICDYYSKALNSTLQLDAKWYMKLDDDSATDVDRLMTNLEYYFDYNEPFYLATFGDTEFSSEEIECLKKTKMESILNTRIPVLHEWESCIISQKALQKIRQSPEALMYLVARTSIRSGPGDQTIALAARMAKIYPMHCPFLCKDPVLEDFSYFGGSLNHIHYVARDIDSGQFQLFVAKVSPNIAVSDGYLDTNSPLYKELENQEFVFYNSHNETLGIVKLSPPCIIEKYSHPNECLWRIRDNKLQFIGSSGLPTTIFDRTDNGNLFVGPVLGATDMTHYLRKLTPVK